MTTTGIEMPGLARNGGLQMLCSCVSIVTRRMQKELYASRYIRRESVGPQACRKLLRLERADTST